MFRKLQFWGRTSDGRLKIEFTVNPMFLGGAVTGGLVVWLVVFLL